CEASSAIVAGVKIEATVRSSRRIAGSIQNWAVNREMRLVVRIVPSMESVCIRSFLADQLKQWLQLVSDRSACAGRRVLGRVADLFDPASANSDQGWVELARLTRLVSLEALAPRGGPVEAVIDSLHGEERSLAGMIAIDDSRDQGVVILVRNI